MAEVTARRSGQNKKGETIVATNNKSSKDEPAKVKSKRPQSQPQSQKDVLDRRISSLSSQAVSLEERADYAKREAQLRKRIQEAQKVIRENQPPGLLDGLSVPGAGGILKRIPTPVKALGVLVTVITVLLIIGKSCTG